MPGEAEAVHRPDKLRWFEEQEPRPANLHILHMRHRVGDYDVTRLILGASNEIEGPRVDRL